MNDIFNENVPLKTETPAFAKHVLPAVPSSEVYLEDCVTALKRFNDNHFDLAIVDPPYGIEIAEWDKERPTDEYWEQLFRVSKNQIVWGGNYFNLPIKRQWICWDKSVIKAIEKAIMVSDLGLTPNNDGKIIRLVIPELTADRRKEYVKLAKKEAEEGKIAVRKIRQDINAKIKKSEKDKEISEDDMKKFEKQIQDLTDLTIKTIDDVLAKKEKEITTV